MQKCKKRIKHKSTKIKINIWAPAISTKKQNRVKTQKTKSTKKCKNVKNLKTQNVKNVKKREKTKIRASFENLSTCFLQL